MKTLIGFEEIEDKIITLRGQKVLLDRDVAALYGVETKRVNEALRNNLDKFPEDSRDQKREYHKDRNRHKDGEYHHRRHNDIIYFFTKCIDQKFLELSRLLVLLIVLKEACRPCQGTHSQDHGVRETKDSSHKRQGEKLYFFCHAHIGIFLDNDLAVRLSDSRGVIVLVLHHDTL